MSGDLKTHHMLEMDTSHLKQSTITMMVEVAERMARKVVERDYRDVAYGAMPVFYDKFPDGFFVPVTEENVEQCRLMPEFHLIMQYAHRLGFSYVMFDDNGPKVSDLPIYKGENLVT